MNRTLIFIALLLYTFSVMGQNSEAKDSFKPVDLQTDHLENPLGIDNPNPRLSWRMEDKSEGAKQKAYRMLVCTDSLHIANLDHLLQNLGNEGSGLKTVGKNESKMEDYLWDTGRVDSDKRLVTYAGSKLNPFTKYYWRVILWNERGQASSSDVHAFETGMMYIANWQGNWISDGNDIHYKPAPYFRKQFSANKEIASARVYIAAAGLYELHVNGNKIGTQRLDPMYTRFDRRNLYVTHDVTGQLQQGENVVGVILGNGWYNHQSLAVWNFENAPWRNRPAFCLDLRITYTDGGIETISTDMSWKRNDGPIIFNSIYTGEHYDARLEQEKWSSPGFDDADWLRVRLRADPSQNITAQQIRPIRNKLTLQAVSFKKIDEQTYHYDFGQNMAGVTQIKVSGKEGNQLRIKHGERLDENGRLDLSNIDVYYLGDNETDPFQTDILTLSGNREDVFMARFNYKGFRYVEVTSSEPVELNKESLTAYFIHSDVPQIGKIVSSNQLINGLCKAINNAYLSNLMGYPTDCPQREKNGWTGDGHFAIETALYNFDGITVYEKWLADHRDEQQPNGVLPDIIPTGGWGYGKDNGLDWTSTIAIIPWEIYRFYGDSKLLADSYDYIKRYVDYVDRTSPEGLTSWGRGDWVPVKSTSNLELTSSVYFFVDATILARAAKLFGREADHQYYTALAEKIKNAINKKYLNRETGIYASGTQTELSVPLQWKVVPEEMIAKVAANLAKKVEEAGFHIDVGVLGAKSLLNALSENGYPHVAYKVAVQDTYPSWGWWVVNGATTLLENWDLDATRDISDNHMMFGEIGAWLYKGLGGIYPDAEQPGFKHIILRPHFEKDLHHFSAEYKSPYGLIKSNWKWGKNRLIYEVVVPANSSATLYLPEQLEIISDAKNRKANKMSNKIIQLHAGSHTLILKERR